MTSPLVEAAQAFDEALGRFGELADSVGRAALDSSEGLARAAAALQKVAACEEEMQQRAQTLSAALTAARQAQEAHAREIGARALDVQKRGETYAALLQQFEAVGRDAVDLNSTAQQLAGANKIDPQMSQEVISPLLAQLGELESRMKGVAVGAETLAGDARAAHFDDLAHKTDVLRQQLLAAHGRIGQLREALTQALPRVNWS